MKSINRIILPKVGEKVLNEMFKHGMYENSYVSAEKWEFSSFTEKLCIVNIPYQAELQEYFRNELNINLYCYQPNETGYWAHSLERKSKYDSYEEALNEAFIFWFEHQ